MSDSLTATDLRNLFALVTTADIKVGQVPSLWISIQRLEVASKSGFDYEAVTQQAAAPAEADGNR